MQERLVVEEDQLRGDRAPTISVSDDCTVFGIQYSVFGILGPLYHKKGYCYLHEMAVL